jgi:hypothetical protein
MVGAITLIIIATYCVVRSTSNAFSAEPQMPRPEGAE